MSAPLPSIAAVELVGGRLLGERAQHLHPGPERGRAVAFPARAPTPRACSGCVRATLSCSHSRVLPMPGSPDNSASRPAAGLHFAEPADQAQPLVGPADEGRARRFVDRAPERCRPADGACQPRPGSWARICSSSDAQLGPGLDPELLDEHVARVLVGAQRVGLPARPVEREHQQLAEPLPDRVLLGEPLGLDRDRRVPAPFEIDRELGLQRDEVQLLEPLALGLRPRLVRDVGEGLAPPEGEARRRGRRRRRRAGRARAPRSRR